MYHGTLFIQLYYERNSYAELLYIIFMYSDMQLIHDTMKITY